MVDLLLNHLISKSSIKFLFITGKQVTYQRKAKGIRKTQVNLYNWKEEGKKASKDTIQRY